MRILVRANSYGSIVLHHHNPVTKRVGKIRAGAMPDALLEEVARRLGTQNCATDLLRHDMTECRVLFDVAMIS